MSLRPAPGIRRAPGARVAVVAALALAAATGCVQEADDPPLEAAGGAREDRPSGDDGGGTLDWYDCGGSVECTELEVPVDYDDPDGATLVLSITRVPASGDRIGALFVNPGGPGGTATDFAPRLAPVLPHEVTEHFDIVGVDPRGLGASDYDCGGDFVELYGLDYSIDTRQDEDELLETSEDYVEGCERAVGDLLPHLGTADVARDLDAVRAAMGDDQLSYLGYSYGTAIGQVLADLFPNRVRAMVLDGVVELGPSGSELAASQAVGFERALEAFVEDCDGDDACPLAPDADEAVDELSAAVEDEPIPARPRDLGPGELAIGMAEPLYDEARWPELADAVDDALDGDGSAMVRLADDYLEIADFDVYFAVNCIDFAWPDTPEELLEDGAAAARRAPHFGEPIVNDYVRCPMWPAAADPLGPVTASGAPPILVVSTTGDPATPHESAERTAERLDSGVLLTHEGEGHGVVGTGVDCVDDAVAEYLVDLETPDDGETC